MPTEFAQRYYREKLGLECEVLPLVVDPERVSCGAGFQPAGNSADWKSAPRFVTFVNPEPRKGVHVFAIADGACAAAAGHTAAAGGGREQGKLPAEAGH